MHDWLDKLATITVKTIEEKYYSIEKKMNKSPNSLREAILRSSGAAIISEIKFASPSKGIIRKKRDLKEIARQMIEGGVIGISILTEPKYFAGDLNFIAEIRNYVDIPLLMKDFILSPVQIDAASKIGANAILFIKTIFDRKYCQENLEQMIEYAHSKGIEVILEVHSNEEFLSALKTSADMVGINNRDLTTLKVDIKVTECILENCRDDGKIIISESGIETPKDVRFLRECGVHAFLIGTTIMESPNIIETIKAFVKAYE
jgi:indole-3-glycerol phosphate synthase